MSTNKNDVDLLKQRVDELTAKLSSFDQELRDVDQNLTTRIDTRVADVDHELTTRIENIDKGLTEKISSIDLGDSPFPIWTDSASTTSPSYGAPVSGVNREARFDSAKNAIGAVLGWRLNVADPKGFVTALRQAFTLVEDDSGNKVVRWVPPSYNVQVIETGVGKITGAQASIHKQATVMVDQILPLLNALEPLDDTADAEDTAAVRSLIRPELSELIEQLGAEGGPVPQRVDTIFNLLVEYDPRREFKALTPEQVGGQLGLLRDRFGLTGARVNTVEEEERLTSFYMIVGNVNSLLHSWHTQRDFFDRIGRDVFFGTQLVLLQRALAVVAESVQEVYFAMDSVFVGASERQIISLHTNPPLTLAELLGWVEELASKKGIDMIRNGGKDGVIFAFAPTVNKLYKLVRNALRPSSRAKFTGSRRGGGLPQALFTRRVQMAWSGLEAHLRRTSALARQIARMPDPLLEFVNVTTQQQTADTQLIDITAAGAHFQLGAEVRLVDGNNFIEGTIKDVADTQIIAAFDVSGAATGRQWDFVVENPDGGEARLENAYTVAVGKMSAPATLKGSVNPSRGVPGARGLVVKVSVSGAALRDALFDFFMSGARDHHIAVDSVTSLGTDSWELRISIDAAASLGRRDIVIHNRVPPFVPPVTLRGAFEVVDAASASKKQSAPARR